MYPLSRYSKEFATKISRIEDPVELEKTLQKIIEEIADLDQRTRDRAGYLVLENIDRLPSVSQRSILNFLKRNNPNASRKLRGMFEGMEQDIALKEKEELLEVLAQEDTADGQEEIIMKALKDGHLTERMKEILRNRSYTGETSQKFIDFVYSRGFNLDGLALVLGKSPKECAKPWLKGVIANEIAQESKKVELEDEAGIDFGYGIESALDTALDAGLEKAEAVGLLFETIYPAKPENARLRSDFLRWAQTHGERDLAYEIVAIDPELKQQAQEYEQHLDFMRKFNEREKEERRKHEEEGSRLRKVVRENEEGLSSPNNPFAEKLEGFKPKIGS